jgi:hypothetical protein
MEVNVNGIMGLNVGMEYFEDEEYNNGGAFFISSF